MCQAFTTLQHHLRTIDQVVNPSKCEIYTNDPANVPSALRAIPVVPNRDAWSYLGTPLLEQTFASVQAAANRVKQSADAIAAFATYCPAQALQLLRATAGACKVEYLLQTLTSSAITQQLAEHCSTECQRAFAAILQHQPLECATWSLATIPQRLGGLGLRDPKAIVESARLASLINVAATALELGAAPQHITWETEKAVALYLTRLQVVVRPELVPSKDLQKLLTLPVHQIALDALIRDADEPTRHRLNSLATPHSTAWLSSSPFIRTLTPVEFRAALRWILGVPFRSAPYSCPDCGATADQYGLHATTCSRSGFITRGHNILRDVMAELFSAAGRPVLAEQSLPDCFERPADILITTEHGRQIALDFTVVTPTRLSSTITSSASTTLMDQAAQQKRRKSEVPCRAVGWTFRPFVADTFGAFHCNARALVSRLISRHHGKFLPLTEAEVGKAVWSAVSSAAVGRAAMQLGRLTVADKPMGLPIDALDLQTSRLRSSILPFVHNTKDTGINDISLAAPSPMEECNDGDLFDIDDTQELDTSNQAWVAPRVINITVCSSANGDRFPLAIAETATLEQLQQQLYRTLGLPPHTFTATVDEALLQFGRPLTTQGVHDASVVTLHHRQPAGLPVQ